MKNRTCFKCIFVGFRALRSGLHRRFTLENTVYFLGSSNPQPTPPRTVYALPICEIVSRSSFVYLLSTGLFTLLLTGCDGNSETSKGNGSNQNDSGVSSGGIRPDSNAGHANAGSASIAGFDGAPIAGSGGRDSSTGLIIPKGPANYSDALSEIPDFSVPYGRVFVSASFEFETTTITGRFADGPEPRFHHESKRIGQCRLVEYTPTFCTPACQDNSVCIDSACVGWPQYIDRGTLLWSWPGRERRIEAVEEHDFRYDATDTISETGMVSVSFEDVTLSAPIVEEPVPEGDWYALLETRDGDVVLRWSNPAQNARIRLYMTDCEGTHGGIANSEIECEGPDTGTLTLPGAFLDALESGSWGRGECGEHVLQRYYAAAPENNDLIRFETLGAVRFYYFPR